MLPSTDNKARPVAAARYPASVEDQSLQNGSIRALFSVARPRKGGQALLRKWYGVGRSLVGALADAYR